MMKNHLRKRQTVVGLKRKLEESASTSTVKKQKIQLRERPAKRLALLVALDKNRELLRHANTKLDETDEVEDSLTSDADSDVDPAWNPPSKRISDDNDDDEEDDDVIASIISNDNEHLTSTSSSHDNDTNDNNLHLITNDSLPSFSSLFSNNNKTSRCQPYEVSLKTPGKRGDFVVYIQSLVSRVFDYDFLAYIDIVNDRFFLKSINAINSVTQSLIRDVESLIMGDKENLHTLISNYSSIEMCTAKAQSSDNVQQYCVVCGSKEIAQNLRKFVEFSLYGVEYDFLSLKLTHKTHKNNLKESVHCCNSTMCMDILVTLHRLIHLNYRIYHECSQKVNQNTSNNQNENGFTKNMNVVLTEILSNDEWIDQLFQIVQDVWARARKLVQACANTKTPKITS